MNHEHVVAFSALLVALACATPPEDSKDPRSEPAGMSSWLWGVWHRKEPDARLPSVINLTRLEQEGSRRALATGRDGVTEIAGSWLEVAFPTPSLGSYVNPPWNECDAWILLPGWPELEGTIEAVVEGESFFLELRITDRLADATALYERRGWD